MALGATVIVAPLLLLGTQSVKLLSVNSNENYSKHQCWPMQISPSPS